MTMTPAAVAAARNADARPRNRIRLGYARVSTHAQDHQAQLDALAAAHCREVVVETASTRGERPKLQAVPDRLDARGHAGDLQAALATELERELIRERTLGGLRAAAAAGRRGGRPVAVTADQLDVAGARLARGESVTAIAAHLGAGRSTLYRALRPDVSGAA